MNTIARCRISMLVGTALVVVIAGTASAQMGISPEMQTQARSLARICRADYNRLCSGVQPGGGRIVACLQSHVGDLTPRCRDALPKAGVVKSDTGALSR